MDATSEREVQITNLLEAGETVVVEFIARAKHTGPLPSPRGPIPPTQRQVSLSEMTVFVRRDGKLADSRAIWDQLDLLGQLGLLAAPPAA